MVKKLSGSPLAAKIMGGILNSSLDERHWDKVLNSDIGNIMPILRLSYTLLPKPLQSCFSFCCIFGQGHLFDKDDLVRMWIALGFIQLPNNREETIEDIGGRYFDALVKKSFFDKFDDYYKMHDLLYELAQFVSKHECLRVEFDQQLFFKTPETIRHLFLKTRSQEELKKIKEYKNLRSLFLTYLKVDDTEIFEEIRSIRLLYISAGGDKMISQTINYLTHLRYLKVDFPKFASTCPTSLCNLYHLQFIIWENAVVMKNRDSTSSTFPREMTNLFNLRYVKHPFSGFSNNLQIGKLTSLQQLDDFEVKNDESGYRIGELEQMNNLQKLSINYLENVEDVEEACKAKLFDKWNLTDLSLKWNSHSNHIDVDEKMLENLRPPSCLQKLTIDKYKGVKSAIWMNMADFISNLKSIKLTGCMNWKILPPFGQLRFLESLRLSSMPKVERFDNKFTTDEELCVFPSLKELYIENLEALKDWFGAASDHGMFPCLTKLDLLNCPELLELPYLPHELKILKIRNSRWNTLNGRSSSKLEELSVSACPNITNIYLARNAVVRSLEIRDCPSLNSPGGHQEVETIENCQLILTSLVINDPSILLMEPLRSITSIKELTIDQNDQLVSFPIGAEWWFLKVSSSLRELNFIKLKSLQPLPFWLQILSSLETLSVSDVPQLQELPNLPPSLAKLCLKNLDNLNCLPSCLLSLKELSITCVTRLRDLPVLPFSLEFLEIIKCDTEFMRRYDKNKGCDLHYISRIPKAIFVYQNVIDEFITPTAARL